MSRGRSSKRVGVRGPEPPPDLEGFRFRSGGSEFVVLTFQRSKPELPECLTAAERAVVEHALEGLRAAAIAQARGVSKRTVCNQLQGAYRKLGVTSRGELLSKLFRA